jgi:long-chain acyl-CoA synthetase
MRSYGDARVASARKSGSLTGTPVIAGARAAFSDDPSASSVIDDSGALGWAEFEAEVDRIAGELRGGGVGPVGILLPSGVRFLATFFASSAAGRPACTLHPDWAEPELRAAIDDAGATTLITDRSGFEPSRPGSERIIGLGPEEDSDPLFYIGFTSGTSGRPKPFARRAKSWTSSFAPAGELFAVGPGDCVFLPGALHNSHFLFGAVFALNRGAGVRLYERYDPRALAADLDPASPHTASGAVVYMVPTMIHDLAETGAGPFGSVHSVVVSGAKMEPRHWQAARDLFPGARISEIYGASELSFVSVGTGERDGDPGYVGRPFPGVEIEIRPLEPGPDRETDDESGLVFARSPYLFEGYIEESATVSPAGGDGFMTVGDVGRLGPDGLSLSGRASNLLITGGKNVHPEEVESVLSRHPSVTGSIVVGMPHERWGEELVAFISFDGAHERPDTEELRDALREEVANFKVPKRWFEVDAIPLTGAGKFDRTVGRLLAGAREL